VIYADEWVCAFAPKTGSSWFSETCQALGAATRYLGGHDPIWRAPRDGRLRGRLTREPCRWYASWFFHCLNSGEKQTEGLQVFGGGSSEFRDVLYGATHPERGRIPPGGIAITGTPHAGDQERKEAGLISAGGVYSWLHRYTYGDVDAWCEDAPLVWDVDVLVPAERINEGVAVFGMDAPAARFPPIGTGQQRARRVRPPASYRGLYTREMVRWVYEAEAEMVAVFGWEPFMPPRQPVFRMMSV